jgi:hypothetical protein
LDDSFESFSFLGVDIVKVPHIDLLKGFFRLNHLFSDIVRHHCLFLIDDFEELGMPGRNDYVLILFDEQLSHLYLLRRWLAVGII